MQEQTLLQQVHETRKILESGQIQSSKRLAALLLAVESHLEEEAQQRARTIAEAETLRRARIVQALNTLSYSEAGALEKVLRYLPETGGLVVASQIADREGLTRSVVVNAIRKLESAGLVKGRSLGMKGTHLDFLAGLTASELAKALENPKQFAAA